VTAARAKLLAMPSRKSSALAIACVLVLAAISCARSKDDHRPAKGSSATTAPAAQRIVAIGGAVTETIYALGAGARVVAVDTSSGYPDATGALPKVGYQRTLAAEGILALEPDLVLASAEAGPPTTIAQLRSAGVRVELLPTIETVEGAAARIRSIGAVLGDRGAGDRLGDTVERDGNAARARAQAHPSATRVLFLYARGGGTMLVSGTGTGPAQMIALAGGVNAVTSWDGFRPLSAEAALAAAPDAILVPALGLASLGGIDGVVALPGLGDTPAGRARRVIAIDDLMLLGFGPRLPAAIDELSAALAGP